MESTLAAQNRKAGGRARSIRATAELSVLLAVVPISAYAQTMIDVRTQTKSIDFSAAGSTRPFQTGTSLPANCIVGQMFFKTNAPTGANMYGCTAQNTWSLQSQGGGSSMAAQLGDLGVVAQNANTLAINSNCSAATPCNVLAAGGTTYSFTSASTATISGTAGAGAATIYVSNVGALTLEYPSGIAGLTIACTACIALATSVPGMPPDAIPIAQVALSTVGGTTSWGTITDRRAFLSASSSTSSAPTVSAGPGGGIVVDCVSGDCGASLDDSFAALQAGNNNFTGNNQVGVGAEGVDFAASNDNMTGTGDRLLAKLTNNGTVIKAAAGDTSGVVGVVLTGTGGTTGFARVRFQGFATCTFDNAAVQGHYVQIAATAGQCHDAGAVKPAAGQIIGTVWSAAGIADHTVLLGLDANSSSGGGSGTTDHAALIHLDYASSGHTGFQPTLGFTPVSAATAGQPNGIATLGADGKVPTAQLPSAGAAGSFGSGAVWDPVPMGALMGGMNPPIVNTVYTWLVSLPAQITVTAVRTIFIGDLSYGGYTSFAVYSCAASGCPTGTLVAQSTPGREGSYAAGVSQAFAANLSVGTYRIAATSDNVHQVGLAPFNDSSGWIANVANSGSTPAIGYCSQSSTGSGPSLAFPSTCSGITAAPSNSVWAVRLVN